MNSILQDQQNGEQQSEISFYKFVFNLHPDINQFMNPSFQRFDKVYEALKNQIPSDIKLKQILTMSLQYSDGWEQKQTSQICSWGSAQYKEKLDEIFEKNKGDKNFGDFSFQVALKQGDKFPVFNNLTSVLTGDQSTIAHKQGEAMLIYILSTSQDYSFSKIQKIHKLLEQNQNWKQNVKVISVNVNDNLLEAKEQILNKKWDKIQHLSLYGFSLNHNILKYLGVLLLPFICIVDKQGIINYLGHPQNLSIEDRINEIINGNSTIDKNLPKPWCAFVVDKQSIGEEKFKKVREKLNIIKKQIQNVAGYSFTQKATRKLQNGKQDICYEKLVINFNSNNVQIQNYIKISRILDDYISDSAILNAFVVKNEEFIIKEELRLLQPIFVKYGLVKRPFYLKEYAINALKSKKWSERYKGVYPIFKIQKDISKEKAYQFSKELQQFYQIYSKYINSHFQYNYRFDFIGLPYFGFTNLLNLSTKQICTLEVQKERAEIIYVYHNCYQQELNLENFVKIVKTLKKNVHISFIVFDYIKQIRDDPYLQNLFNANPGLISIYNGKNKCPQFRFFHRLEIPHLFIINQNGILVKTGKIQFNQIQKILDLDFQPQSLCQSQQQKQKQQELVSKEDIDTLSQFLTGKQFQSFQEQAKSFDYQPQFNIRYSEKLDTKQYTKPTVSISARKNHLDALKNMISSLQKIATVSTTIVETFVIPTGTICQQCKTDLKYPYYYYHFSSTFRCVDCAEKCDNETQDLLKKYAVNENGVLVFKQNSQVDVKRFGKNIQPTSKQEAQRPSFKCNGCMRGIQDTRYVCMGCRRQPNMRGDYVDFCRRCADVLKGDGDKSLILQRSKQQKHKQDHPLVRIVFSPKGYKDY